MIGTPPSARTALAIPADPAEHARRFAIEYANVLERYVEGRMHALDISDDTPLAVTEGARQILRAMAAAERKK